MKGQISTFIKIISIVISAGILVFVVIQYQNYTTKVEKEKESSQFNLDTLSILQKLVTSEDCLAYKNDLNTSFKPVLDKSKIDDFVLKYKDVEPDCAKALGFDYGIEITQLEKEFSLYPGEKIVEGECIPKNVIAFHELKDAYYFVCDQDLSNPDVAKKCCTDVELDACSYCSVTEFPGKLPCGAYCAPYDCKNFTKTAEECDSIYDNTKEKACCIRSTCGSTHPWYMECYNIDPEKDCTPVTLPLPGPPDYGYYHAWCGNGGTFSTIATGGTINVSVQQEIWEFSVSSGVSSFSPEKAIGETIELSIPVTIRYNETFSAEGILKIKAVKGELEDFYSTLDDICSKAKENIQMDFSRYFKFSYPVNVSGNKICMLDSCKIFECPLSLNFNEIGSGEYNLKFSSNLTNNEIKVEK